MDKNLAFVIKQIKDLKIQGATNIAYASLLALGEWTTKTNWHFAQLKFYADKLAFARPTEPLTQNCLKWFLAQAKNKEGQALLNDANEIILALKNSFQKTIDVGSQLIKDGLTIMTHCHSSSVVAMLVKAKKQGKKFKVFLTETRPRYQGRITATELVKANIETTMVVDSQAPFLISCQSLVKIDLVLIGADAINADGSAINKVGSYSLSLSAAFAKIPFYVTAVLLKFTPLSLPIEERNSDEIWSKPPHNLRISNPAFDKVPASFITAFITEVGLVKPTEIKKTIALHYPWLLK